MTGQRRIFAHVRLRECPEQSIGLALPVPISDRVDSLVALAEAAGERTNRKELIASIILAVAPDGAEITSTLRKYRHATARDALVNLGGKVNTISLRPRRPGPRPRRRT